jgi:hypothetical protein
MHSLGCEIIATPISKHILHTRLVITKILREYRSQQQDLIVLSTNTPVKFSNGYFSNGYLKSRIFIFVFIYIICITLLYDTNRKKHTDFKVFVHPNSTLGFLFVPHSQNSNYRDFDNVYSYNSLC